MSDIFKIVVFSTGSETGLAGGCPLVGTLFLPEEDLFKLDHSGGGEKQSRIIRRNKRGAGDYFVAISCKVIKKKLPYFLALEISHRLLLWMYFATFIRE